ncbi:hypothetical protein MNBD_ALPHA06-1824 [hydrothermal vent metagenome]|uniref:Uncharacterized protein n=1 Tax=hydrothermal vent metagenome TaxID=652676 RepID=A0A3B0RW58_9ZZZZ
MEPVENQRKDQNELLVFLAKHLVTGLVLGGAVLGLILWLDVGGLRTLIWQSSSRGLAIFMLMLVFATTFGGLATAAGMVRLFGQSGQK